MVPVPYVPLLVLCLALCSSIAAGCTISDTLIGTEGLSLPCGLTAANAALLVGNVTVAPLEGSSGIWNVGYGRRRSIVISAGKQKSCHAHL